MHVLTAAGAPNAGVVLALPKPELLNIVDGEGLLGYRVRSLAVRLRVARGLRRGDAPHAQASPSEEAQAHLLTS